MTEHIQINDVAPRIHYDADGVQSAFTYPFAIFKAEDLEVWLGGLRQMSGFSVSGAGISSGGAVLFAVPPANGSQVILRRRVALQRVSDYQTDGIIRAKTLNDEFDYQVAAVQQVAEDVSRCIQRPFTSADTANLALPEPQGGKALGWNLDGTALVNDPASFADTLAQVTAHAVQTAADEQSTRTHRLAADADAALTAQDRVAVAADRVVVHGDRLAAEAAAVATAVDRSAVAVDTAMVVADTAIVTASRDQVVVLAADVVAAHADVSAGRDVAVASASAAASSAAQAGISAAQAQAAVSGAAVRVSAADTTANYLVGSVEAGSHIGLSVQNPGADERLRIDVTGLGALATKNSIDLTDTSGVTSGTLVGRSSAGSGAMEGVSVGAGLALAGGTLSCTLSPVDMGARDQLALTNLRQLLSTSVSSGALAQGYQWELATDEWSSGSSGSVYAAGTPNYWTNLGTVPATCKLLIHSEAANGNATFADSATAKAVAGFGGVAHSSAQAKFGVSSILMNGTTQYLQLADSADWTMGSNDFTMEMWIRPAAGGSCLLSQFEGGTGTASHVGFYWNLNADGKLAFGANNIGGGMLAVNITTTNAVTFNTWNHVAVSRVAGTVKVFVNGVAGASASGWTGWTDSDLALKIGASTHLTNGVISFYSGYMEEIAWYNGFGKYPADFAVPTAPMGSNTNMVLVSPVVPVSSAPSNVSLYFLYKDDSASAVLGTDLTCDLSADGGANWAAATLSTVATYDGTYSIVKARATVSGHPGTLLKGRIQSLNAKAQRVTTPAIYKE